ncbi:amidohydrolase [Denitrobacterium detoxificans]|uniref:amidohydrolase n=1 Tax=Denitrobacterium detoxificans TaxID=79604 RepID=UPI0026E9C41B|nr:amidohydrolase [Denitrobacterium detoxificans]MBE6465893.1 amidohydrolase [Denitrobacterium detoxificans]
MFADAIVISKNLFTGLDDTTQPGAFAIQGEHIMAVGSEADMMTYAQCSTRIIDAGEAFVCPGLHDSHLHFFHSALYASPLAMRYCGTSEQDCVAALAPLAARRPEGSWLLCQGWRNAHWNPSTLPTKHSLDAVYPNQPVAMYSGDAHTLWLNSYALQQLDIRNDSPDPEGGSYERDENGELTGLVHEAAAMALMPRIVESFTPDELASAYRALINRCVAHGITSICDMSLMALPGLDFVRDDIFAELERRNDLNIRVHMFPTLLEDTSRLTRMQESYTEGKMRACGFKQFFDGVSSQHTAWVKEPYTNALSEHDCGRPTIDPNKMRELVMKAQRMGQPVRVHAIGDEAIHVILDIFEDAREAAGPLPQGKHHCIEHLENFQPADIARLAQLDVVAAVQPMHITLDPGAPEADLGPKRVPYMWPFRTLLDTGATLAFGTDSPVVDIDPRPGLFTAVTRQFLPAQQPEEGWLPTERITQAEALRAYTLGSARACSRESELGTIEPGKLADFVIWDTNLVSCNPVDILSAQVQLTYLGGKEVFQAN